MVIETVVMVTTTRTHPIDVCTVVDIKIELVDMEHATITVEVDV
jgi:hypothetical protein